jgi:hypothetical protein
VPRRDRLIVAAMLRERCKPYIFTLEEIQQLLAAGISSTHHSRVRLILSLP